MTSILESPKPDQNYAEQIALWRQDRENRLQAKNGWLSLAGLFLLHEGDNLIGVGEQYTIDLPAGYTQERVGKITLSGECISATIEEEVGATLDGNRFQSAVLKSDKEGMPDRIAIGPLTLTVIVRGGRTYCRLCNNESVTRTGFKGLDYFPVNPEFCVNARFELADRPIVVSITDALGDVEEISHPGYLQFKLAGLEYRLLVQDQGDELFINFRDQTSGNTSYGAGRFLYTPKPADGHVVLDFNHAYTPPCGFTPHATCPLPPRANHLSVAIEAGEKYANDAH